MSKVTINDLHLILTEMKGDQKVLISEVETIKESQEIIKNNQVRHEDRDNKRFGSVHSRINRLAASIVGFGVIIIGWMVGK
jgi:hypothetical protein